MPIWHQTYDPFNFWPLSTLVSALPVLTLFFVLIVLKKSRLGGRVERDDWSPLCWR